MQLQATNISELNAKYKLESLSLLPDYCLQDIFSRDFKNIKTAKIAFLLSDHSRRKVLSNLNTVRADEVSSMLDRYESGEISSSFSSFEKTCEALLDRVQYLKDTGAIKIPEIGLDESFFNISGELNNFSDNLPRFNFYHNDLHDLISWWDLAAKSLKSLFGKRIQVENIILERLEDEFSSKIFSLSINDLGEKDFIERSEKLRKLFFDNYKNRLNLIETFFSALAKKSNNKYLAANLAYTFPQSDEMTSRLIKHGPLLLLPAIKDGLPLEDIAMSLYKLKIIHDENGPEEVVKFTRKADDHFFRKGLSIILSEMEWSYAQRIIRERKKAYIAEFDTKLKMIIDASACIRNNLSPYIMLELMSSYTVYDFEG
ncbi:hypothetical protein [Maridesulfovibrio hydrothermalis]|uniref:Uncharacterized protein n=1 Tax=Maridesulfovibrio hydrothermalis AM13 = DSM 14728 TaxID=1121451 RepID=L0R8H6_9BACT|nr:hypothetical protein [Maridesulfovibrio hydrothermalis]CCO23063.1 conserved protein of unknown function [Maridesulfovibrio hydrothermalis AM13 = DSM 14728]